MLPAERRYCLSKHERTGNSALGGAQISRTCIDLSRTMHKSWNKSDPRLMFLRLDRADGGVLKIPPNYNCKRSADLRPIAVAGAAAVTQFMTQAIREF